TLEGARIATHGPPATPATPSRLFALYERFDRRLRANRNRPDPMRTAPVSGAERWHASDPALAGVDVVLDLARTVAPRGVRAATALWACEHGDGARSLTGTTAFAARLMAGERSTPVELVDVRSGRVLERSWVAAHPLSLQRIRETALAKAVVLPARLL